MIKFFLVIILFNSLVIKSQDLLSDSINNETKIREKAFEVAYSVFTINSKNELRFSKPHTPTFEFLNGFLIRYRINKVSFRLNASVSKIRNVKEYDDNCINCSYGIAESRNYKLGLGCQFPIFKKKDVLYSYCDVNYKRRKENGVMVEINNAEFIFNNYWAITNGLDLIIGIGTRLKINKFLSFSAEVGYNNYTAESEIKSEDLKSGQLLYQTTPLTFHSIIGKIYLSVVF